MSMFKNYDAIPATYIPDNIVATLPPASVKFYQKEPIPEYNIKGDFIGYSWEQGDTLTVEISVNKMINVEGDSLVFETEGESPSSDNGRIGRKAYNVVDIKSWLCVAINGADYVWKEDKIFTYPTCGTKEVTLMTNKDIAGKTIKFSIYDFRRNIIFEKEYDGSDTIKVVIDEELAEKLIRGIYFFNYTIDGVGSSDVSAEFAIIVK